MSLGMPGTPDGPPEDLDEVAGGAVECPGTPHRKHTRESDPCPLEVAGGAVECPCGRYQGCDVCGRYRRRRMLGPGELFVSEAVGGPWISLGWTDEGVTWP